jgi:hypothetical protein
MDFDDDYNDGNDDMFIEIGASERVGPSGVLSELLSSGSNDLKKKGARNVVSPEDQFLITVDAVSRKIGESNTIKITKDDIEAMLKKTLDIKGLKYKNGKAYILGYLASKGGRELKKDNVLFVINNVLPEISDGGIEPADVIRYARFWMDLGPYTK